MGYFFFAYPRQSSGKKAGGASGLPGLWRQKQGRHQRDQLLEHTPFLSHAQFVPGPSSIPLDPRATRAVDMGHPNLALEGKALGAAGTGTSAEESLSQQLALLCVSELMLAVWMSQFLRPCWESRQLQSTIQPGSTGGLDGSPARPNSAALSGLFPFKWSTSPLNWTSPDSPFTNVVK